jgi:hypothetical protein
MRRWKQINYLKNEKGAVLVVELVVLAIVLTAAGFAGYQYVSHKGTVEQATKPKPHVTTMPTPSSSPNVYAGWRTCNDTADSVSFKYPPSWATGASKSDPCSGFKLAANGQEFVLQSPTSNGLSFTLFFFPAVPISNLENSNSGQSGGDHQVVQTVQPFALNSGKSVSLVSYLDVGSATSSSNQNQISTIGISAKKYSAGQVFFALEGITSPTSSSHEFTLYASLAPPGSQSLQTHTIAEYQSHPAYQDLINIFRSVTY